MKRPGPPFGSGPGSDNELRVAGQRSHTRSDTGRASQSPLPLSQSKQSAPATHPADAALLLILRPRGRSRFDALVGETQIVKSSAQPISDAARFLHSHGYSDDRLLIVRHEDADHDAIRGRLGIWRRVRVREDRGPPRQVAWEPLPRRVRARKGLTEEKGTVHRAGKKNGPPAAPGASKQHSPAPVGQNSVISDSERRSNA
jgi:hypothetical protein